MTGKPPSFYTLAVQIGQTLPADDSGAAPAMPPIIPSVGFTYPTMRDTDRALGDNSTGYVYSRHGAPTQAALEKAVTTLEGAEAALSFGSGMAALHAALLAVTPPGSVVVAAAQLYGATRTLLGWMSASMGIAVHYADFLDMDTARRAITETEPVAVICEVLTNPLVRVVPVDEIVRIARSAGAKLVVDNTFATPFLLRPLEIGADLVVHSATKYLNGHGDVLGGVVAGSSELIQVVRGHRKLLGATLGPFDAWLALRGLRTLAVRMRQSCLNAHQIAAWLDTHERVKQVYYPGLSASLDHMVACRLFRHDYFGGMLAFEIDDLDREGAFAFVERLEIIRPVTSLGDVNSLISHPATASHRALTPQERAAQRITEGTLRLSVGIEDPEDLTADLDQALAVIG